MFPPLQFLVTRAGSSGIPHLLWSLQKASWKTRQKLEKYSYQSQGWWREEGGSFFFQGQLLLSCLWPENLATVIDGPRSITKSEIRLYLVRAHMLSCLSLVRLCMTLWTAACQAPLSMGILQTRILEWIATPSSRGSFGPRDPTCVSYIWPVLAGRFFTTSATYG